MPGSDRPNVLTIAQSVPGAWPTIPALMRLMSSQATFEPVSAKTQPVSGHTTCQIPDIENSCSRDSSRKTPPSVYYEPLRHPKAPGLSLAGFQLVIALTTPWGFPCCVRFPCVHAVATTPAQRLGVWFRSVTQPYQPSPIWQSGRPAHRPFRGLLGVHSRYGLHTRAVTNS